MSTVSLYDVTSVLTPVTSGGGAGSLINDLRDDCGYVIQGIDWVCRKLGFDLIDAILGPIAGDYDAVAAMSQNWARLGDALGIVSDNYTAISGATASVWVADAAENATKRMDDFATAFADRAEACSLIAVAIQDMLETTRAVVSLVAEVMSFLDEVVMMMISSAVGVTKEVLTGGAKVRKAISLIQKAISAIETLLDIVPPLMKACALLGALVKGIDTVFSLPGSIAANSNAGSKADDLAGAGF